MEITVYWSQFAEDKLNDIFNYYKLKASYKIAQNLINGIIDKTINLGKNPQIGQIENLLIERNQEFRYLVYKNYKIIYWTNKQYNRVEIANIFDCRQNPEKMGM